ncbi:DUF3995 domain-containing protein [Thalassotalea ganghwensis]
MLEIILIIILLSVAILHLLWAMRIWWPIANEAALAKAVVGIKGIEKMPSAWLTWLVTLIIFIGVLLVAMLSGFIPLLVAHQYAVLAGWIMGAILVVRAIYPYLFDRYIAQEHVFRRMNRAFYSPMILLLGLGVWSLLI